MFFDTCWGVIIWARGAVNTHLCRIRTLSLAGSIFLEPICFRDWLYILERDLKYGAGYKTWTGSKNGL